MPGHRHTRRHHEEVTGLVDFHVPPLKDLKHDIGNMLNKAIAAIEDENDALASVLKNNIDFNAVKGKSKIPDQKWKDLLDPGDRSRRPRRGSYCRPCWSPQRLLKRSYPTLCDPIRSDGYIVPGPRARAEPVAAWHSLRRWPTTRDSCNRWWMSETLRGSRRCGRSLVL